MRFGASKGYFGPKSHLIILPLRRRARIRTRIRARIRARIRTDPGGGRPPRGPCPIYIYPAPHMLLPSYAEVALKPPVEGTYPRGEPPILGHRGVFFPKNSAINLKSRACT